MKKLVLTASILFAFSSVQAANLVSPILLKPENGANLSLKKAAKFTWKKAISATKYRIIFSADKQFSTYDVVKNKCLSKTTCFVYTVSSPSYSVAASHAIVKKQSNYFWQVQAVNLTNSTKISTSTSKGGEIRSFSVGTLSPYSKIANDGSVLSDDAQLGIEPTDWACTKDNKTGLIWEVKTDTDGLRNMNNSYSWYEPDASKNGGFEGYKNNSYYNDVNICKESECDSYAYKNAVNEQGLCGSSDWRMPTLDDLKTIVKSGTAKPTIDTTYFPNTPLNYFWSSLPSSSNGAWLVYFGGASTNNTSFKGSNYHVRLVH